MNSVAYCLKFSGQGDATSLIELYQKALQIDKEDVEANFNIGLVYL